MLTKYIQTLLFTSLLTIGFVAGQHNIFQISEQLQVIKLSETTYIHTSQNNNGLVYTNQKKAIIVSTPMSDAITKELVKWITHSLKCEIIACVIDMWHPDGMEGLDVMQAMKIPTYANELTRKIAQEKKLPIPDKGFDTKLILDIGDKKTECRYFGPGHTLDGIVVWIPDEKILFGSNTVRNMNGWVGNIADADVKSWSATVEKIKAAYWSAEIVIPGHGKYGGTELLDYTIALYKPNRWMPVLKHHDIECMQNFYDYGHFFDIARRDTTINGVLHLTNATLFVDNGDEYLLIKTPFARHDVKKKTITSDVGMLKIFKKNAPDCKPIQQYFYKTLIVKHTNDAVEKLIIMKEFIW